MTDHPFLLERINELEARVRAAESYARGWKGYAARIEAALNENRRRVQVLERREIEREAFIAALEPQTKEENGG